MNFAGGPRASWAERIHDAYAKEDVTSTLDEFRAELQEATASTGNLATRFLSGGPPDRGPEPEPAPKRRIDDEKWTHDKDLDQDHRSWNLNDLLGPDRVCTEAANTSPAE